MYPPGQSGSLEKWAANNVHLELGDRLKDPSCEPRLDGILHTFPCSLKGSCKECGVYFWVIRGSWAVEVLRVDLLGLTSEEQILAPLLH